MSGMNNSKIPITLGDMNAKIEQEQAFKPQLAGITYMKQQTIML